MLLKYTFLKEEVTRGVVPLKQQQDSIWFPALVASERKVIKWQAAVTTIGRRASTTTKMSRQRRTVTNTKGSGMSTFS